MPKINSSKRKSYSNYSTAVNYSREKLLHEAKMIINRNYPNVDKKTNALNKQKSLLLSKIEDSIEALLDILEKYKRSKELHDANKLLNNNFKSSKKFKEEKKFLEQKIFTEFQTISNRVFTPERVKRIVSCMFSVPPPLEKLDYDDRVREVTIANILLIGAMSVLRKNLDSRYYQFLSEYLDKAQDLARTIEGTLRGPLKSDLIQK